MLVRMNKGIEKGDKMVKMGMTNSTLCRKYNNITTMKINEEKRGIF